MQTLFIINYGYPSFISVALVDSFSFSRCLNAELKATIFLPYLIYVNGLYNITFLHANQYYESPFFISVACVDSFSFSRCLAKARIAAVCLCSLAELDSVTRVKKNEECIMSVVNPGIPRVKVTDPTVLSIKELISRGELNPSNSQGPKRASHPFVR